MYSSVFLVVATFSTKYTFTHLQIKKKGRHMYNKHVRTRNSTSLMTIAFLVEVEYSERARHPCHRGRSILCDRWRRCILKPRSTGARRSRIQVYISVYTPHSQRARPLLTSDVAKSRNIGFTKGTGFRAECLDLCRRPWS